MEDDLIADQEESRANQAPERNSSDKKQMNWKWEASVDFGGRCCRVFC